MNEHDEFLNGTAWRMLAVVLGAAGLALALALGWQPAQAAGVVTDCSNDAQLRSVLEGGGAVALRVDLTPSRSRSVPGWW